MPSFNISDMVELQNRLIRYLVANRGSDGFYRSSPLGSDGPPSFTNTGVVLQAFNECNAVHHAQVLADKLDSYYVDRNFRPLPHEKFDGVANAHLMCNSWAVFALLECFPIKVAQYQPMLDWFIDSQREDHSWGLLPKDNTKYPIFTAYGISALLQFYDCYSKIHTDKISILNRIQLIINNAVDYLFRNRTLQAMSSNLLIWPSSIRASEDAISSFSTSAMCMHVIYKASNILNRPDWKHQVHETFLALTSGYEVEDREVFKVANMEIKLWDMIHVNEGHLNYLWCFFAPINLVTLSNFMKEPRFQMCDGYWNIISYFTDWIIRNKVEINDMCGVRGSNSISDVKIWSTAQAAIGISRVVKCIKDNYIVASQHLPNLVQ